MRAIQFLLAATGAAVTVGLVSGCQTNATLLDESSRSYRDVSASEVVLKQTVRVPAGRARVFLQDAGEGRTRISTGFNSYAPHCGFEIRPVDHDGFDIVPDSFFVTRIQRTTVMVVEAAPLQVAWLGIAGMDGDSGGSQSYYDGYHFYLTSEAQPDVMRMTCYGAYAEPYELYPPTLQEIASALGDVAELRY